MAVAIRCYLYILAGLPIVTAAPKHYILSAPGGARGDSPTICSRALIQLPAMWQSAGQRVRQQKAQSRTGRSSLVQALLPSNSIRQHCWWVHLSYRTGLCPGSRWQSQFLLMWQRRHLAGQRRHTLIWIDRRSSPPTTRGNVCISLMPGRDLLLFLTSETCSLSVRGALHALQRTCTSGEE